MTPKKVIHLITLLEMGGAQGNTIYTVEHLNEKDFEAHLWTGKGAYWDKTAEQKWGNSGRLKYIKHLVRPIRPLQDLLAFFEIKDLLKKEKPDIIHTHSSKAGIIGRLAAHSAKIPIIIHTFHGFGFNPEQTPWIRNLFIWLERKVAQFSTALIFVSRSNLDLAKSLQIGDPKNYHLIRSGVSLERLQNVGLKTNAAELRRNIGIPDKSRIIITIGPFKPQKNHFDFFRMAKHILGYHQDAHFIIIGDGALREKYEEFIIENGLVGRVHLPGWRQDVDALLSISDVFVLSSLWEGLPRSLVEAMALGIPSVCYKTDGILDVLSDGGGILVAQKDVKSLAQGVHKLLSESTEWARLAAEAKAKISSDFDINHMVRQQEILYKDCLAGN